MRYRSRRTGSLSGRMVAVIVTVALILGFIMILFVYDAIEDARRLQNKKEFEERVRELNVEKNELKDQAEALSRQVMDSLGSGACLPIVVYGTDAELYEFIFPLFGGEEGSEVLPSRGILALSPEELPGMEGRITEEQFASIVEAGWQIVVYWDGQGNLAEHLDYMKIVFVGYGLDPADTVLFRHGAYKTEYDSMLIREGIKYIFHSGEEFLDYVESGAREEGELWHIGAVGWNTYGVSSTMLTSLLASGGVLAFTVDFTVGSSAYDGTNIACVASFQRMFEKLNASRNTGDLFVTDLAMCEAVRERYIEQAAEILGDNADFRHELDRRIAEIDKQIADIYREYSNK